MLRHGNPAESVLVYATFFALSIAVHLIVILGTRSRGAEPTHAPDTQQLTQTAPAQVDPAQANPAQTNPATAEPARPPRDGDDLVSAREATQ